MKPKPLTYLLVLTFLFLFSGSSVVFGDDFTDGVDAYQKQDYKTAHKLWLLLAEQGHAQAQFNLGMMYVTGQGVPQDDHAAVTWYRRAAEQGSARAQNNLGLMYDHGLGVPQDYVLAHMWFNLAGSNGLKVAVGKRSILEKKMTPSQREEAQRLARNWKPTKK